MKKNLMLGLFLFAVIFVGATMMVSAVGCGSNPSCSQCTDKTSCEGGGCTWGKDSTGDDFCKSKAIAPPGANGKIRETTKPGFSPGRGWTETKTVDGESCYILPTKSKGLFTSLNKRQKISGKVIISGEFTQESCDMACANGGKVNYEGGKTCACNPEEISRNGKEYCKSWKEDNVCGRLGERVTANDGAKFTFTRSSQRGFITVNIQEPFRQLPKNA